jgi:hypothetical protein
MPTILTGLGLQFNDGSLRVSANSFRDVIFGMVAVNLVLSI